MMSLFGLKEKTKSWRRLDLKLQWKFWHSFEEWLSKRNYFRWQDLQERRIFFEMLLLQRAETKKDIKRLREKERRLKNIMNRKGKDDYVI